MTAPTKTPGRKPRGRHPDNALSTALVRNVTRAGRYCDGHGLYLEVQPSGSRSWIQRIAIRGRRREIGLGGFPLVSLKEAREQAFANRKLARSGGDPLAGRRRAKSMPTFADAAERVWNDKRPGWRNPRHAHDWKASMARYVVPRIGRMAVGDVASADVLAILTPIWHARPETARRVRQRISAVMEWAAVMEYRTDNPCERIGAVLGPQRAVVQHLQAVPHGEVASAIRAVQASRAMPAAKLAFEFLVLTATRSGEVRGAEWAEVDLAAGVWTIPATRMKMQRAHRVPLCARAAHVLETARTLDGGSRLVFPGGRGTQIDDNTLSRLLRDLGIAGVPHGFRSSFRDWAAEKTDHPREVIEAALAHVVPNKVEAAYARSDLFERRRLLMDDWAAYVVGGAGRWTSSPSRVAGASGSDPTRQAARA